MGRRVVSRPARKGANPAMVPEVSSPPLIADPSSSPRHRYRLRFKKTGDLRLVSHHDLMHVLERLMRRAEVPFALTQGFHPQPKISFALALALGVAGLNEAFELELSRAMEPD